MESRVHMVNYQEARQRLVEWLKTRLMGPFNSETSVEIEGHPLNSYEIGVVFPIIKGDSQLDNKSTEDVEGLNNKSENEDDSTEPAKRKVVYQPPSSAGLSFYVKETDGISLHISGEVHKFIKKEVVGNNIQYEESNKIVFYEDYDFSKIEISTSKSWFMVFDKCEIAKCMLKVRPYRDQGYIITVAIVNTQEILDVEHNTKIKFNTALNQKALFGVQLSCVVKKGQLREYPRADFSLLSDDEQELDVRYRDTKIYGVGHGASVNWKSNNGVVDEVCLDFLPTVEVPQVTADIDVDKQCLQLAFLSGKSEPNDENITHYLGKFIHGYEAWIEETQTNSKLSNQEKKAGHRITSRMRESHTRMQSTLNTLRQSPDVMHVFKIANRAMLEQMKNIDVVRGKSICEENYCWRPFQLAFLLTVLESVINDEDDYRDVVDLIWFPTGGGKTEAYLGVISLLIAWRRNKYPTSGHGTNVIMRYTLRLLTTQQFERACFVIFALEKLRKSNPEFGLGTKSISIGLWVGGATSPNTYRKAKEIVEDICHDSNSRYKLVVHKCPWCHTEFSGTDNYIAKDDKFSFKCLNMACDFGGAHSEVLPCAVVDEELYRSPPTLVFGTIDKFARLTREPRAGAFFGGKGVRPPELIVQDELHLISGELGSIAGLYEAGIETVLQYKGVYPKYIASTATIRNATEQVSRLYGKDVSVFPPPGLNSDDSYFAKTVPIATKPGRLYLGYMPTMLNRSDSLKPLAANLLVAPDLLFSEDKDKEALLDAWWTQVVYHSSLVSVGKSQNVYNYEIPKQTDYWWKNTFPNRVEHPVRKKYLTVPQLTSLSTVFENAKTFSLLEKPVGHPRAIDAVLATNMVSVGLDVSRLAVMIINGQPLTTAEYIQASSRVGRGEVPGIVVANLYKNQARSLSHYENFRGYHESFYRFVEPTSVTPFTYQSRKKALPAALLIAMRHSIDELSHNQGAFKLDINNAEVKKVIQLLEARLRKSGPKKSQSVVSEHVDQLINEWACEVEVCKKSSESLVYVEDSVGFSSREVIPLLRNFEKGQKGLWDVMNSMRNVEATGLLES
jgi:hypothetical protein